MTAAPSFPNVSDGPILDEDQALRKHLMGLTVSDSENKSRPVTVWYSHPDLQIREQRYPYMVVSLVDITEAKDRVMSGQTEISGVDLDVLTQSGIDAVIGADGKIYNALGLWSDVWMDSPSVPLRFLGNPPIPIQIDYQVRAFSRHPRHDRMIVRDMFSKKISFRYSSLDMTYINGDVRRMQLIDYNHGESVEGQKRLFVSAFTIRVDSFMPYGVGVKVVEDQFVLRVIGDLKFLVNGQVFSDGTFGWSVEANVPA